MPAAHAQFSLLPYADPEVPCAQMLNKYEINREFPRVAATIAEVTLEKTLQNALKEYQTANAELIKTDEDFQNAKTAYDGGKGPGSYEGFSAANEKRKEAEAKALAKAEALSKLESATKGATKTETPAKDPVRSTSYDRDNLLGCAIKTGKITLAMIPYFITYIINFLLALSGLISVLFIVIGGYQYVYGGLGENKDKAKKTINHALMGLAIAILAWSIVNAIINAVTG